MIKATYADKAYVLDILVSSFQNNASVLYLIPPGADTLKRIRALMDYSFETCFRTAGVFLSEDRNACALLTDPGLKVPYFRSLWLEAKLVFQSISVGNLSKAIAREQQIRVNYPEGPRAYLWFIGVIPEQQNKGLGSKLLQEVIAHTGSKPLYLETSVPANVKWYKKTGFEVYKTLNFGYELSMMRRVSTSH